MGLFDKLRNEFIDIIEWKDDTNDTMVWRFPRYQDEIKNGAQLTVRESQVAVFLNEGVVADEFKPGRFELKTANLPILSTLRGWKYGFDSPFKADIFFVSTKTFINQKWGTKNPIMLRDAEFGPIRLRAFGNYAFRVADATKFLKEIVGTQKLYTVDEINEQLRNLAVTRGMDAIAESKIPVLDLASNYDELSKFITNKIGPEFLEMGIEITKFLVENISLPPEVEAALDKRSSMGIIGNLGAYAQFQAANAMEAAASNPAGGLAGAGMGAGLGMGMMGQMGNMFQQNQFNPNAGAPQGGAGAPPPLPTAVQYFVAVNGAQTGPFEMGTLQAMAMQGTFTKQSLVWKNGMAGWVAAETVAELAGVFAVMPPPVPPTA